MAQLSAFDVEAVVRARADWFPVTREYTYLNHAAYTPLPTPAVEAMTDFLQKHRLGPKYEAELLEIKEQARRELARLINADPEEVTFIPTTSTGISLAAWSLPLRRGDNVIICDQEYPANVYPWLMLQKKRGVKVKILPAPAGGLTPEMVAAAADSRTRVVSVSAVQFLSGFRADLAALGRFCRERRIYFVVDAMQALGALRIDVKAEQVDILAAAATKFLMGPPGIGPFYVRKELIPELEPPVVGANSVVGFSPETFLAYDLKLLPTADRFYTAQVNRPGIAGLGAVVRLFNGLGPENIERRVLRLADFLVEQLKAAGYRVLSDFGPKHRSAIVSFAPPDPLGAYRKLTAARVIVSLRYDRTGRPYTRVSPHFYNTEDEIRQVVDTLQV